MTASLMFAPLAPWPLIAAAGALAAAMVALALWRRSPGWGLRALAFGALLFAVANPSLVREERRGLPDIVFVVIDDSASQTIPDRPGQTATAQAGLKEALDTLALRGGTEAPLDVRTVRVAASSDPLADTGSRLLTALDAAAAEVAQDRIAGAILVTDGQVHDADRLVSFPGPVHVLLTGEEGEADYRLAVDTAPAFGLVGGSVQAVARVLALGTAPSGVATEVLVSIDGGAPRRVAARVGQPLSIELPITHGGSNVVELSVPMAPGELTDRNNRAVFTVNGVRDRLRVLLVSGEPHPGERTWRNLLKADPSVDLVHFTILRPPSKQDGTPVYELSLIAFRDAEGNPRWGRWFRHVEVEPLDAEVLMSGAQDSPLLILDRVGEGRVAVLASDHAWLWSRGVEGGGPQAELLRRLAHWLMKEPELEEEALNAAVAGSRMTVTRRSTGDGPDAVRMTAPSGAETVAPFTEIGPGQWQAVLDVAEQGLHRLDDGTMTAVAAVGPPAPKEFENPISSPDLLAPLAEATGGAVVRLAGIGIPELRRVREARAAEGRGWIGLVRREAYAVEDVRLTPLAPGWLMLLLTAGLLVAAWRFESR